MPPSSRLSADVYVVGPTPMAKRFDNPMKNHWSPTCCTLIHTPNTAILVDVPATLAETEAVADWVDKTAPTARLKYFFTTHRHGDHYLGVPVLQRRYPGIKVLATANVAKTADAVPLSTWNRSFPNGQVTDLVPTLEALPSNNNIDLDGHILTAYDVVQGDSQANSFLHIPELGVVVAGDLVYGDCFQYLGEANTKEKRANWIKAVEQIESLKPQVIIPGHKRMTQIDGLYLAERTKEYIRTFDTELEHADSSDALERRILELYPERWNEYILQRSCETSFPNKGK